MCNSVQCHCNNCKPCDDAKVYITIHDNSSTDTIYNGYHQLTVDDKAESVSKCVPNVYVVHEHVSVQPVLQQKMNEYFTLGYRKVL